MRPHTELSYASPGVYTLRRTTPKVTALSRRQLGPVWEQPVQRLAPCLPKERLGEVPSGQPCPVGSGNRPGILPRLCAIATGTRRAGSSVKLRHDKRMRSQHAYRPSSGPHDFLQSRASTRLPEADIPVDGVRHRLLQGPKQQQVFFDIVPIGEVPPHSHGAP